MEVFKFEPKSHFGSVCYVLKDGNSSLIIDPSVSPDEILAECKSLSPQFIILTHTHFDHMFSLTSCMEAFPDATLLVSSKDIDGFTSPYYNVSLLFYNIPVVYDGQYRTVTHGESFIFADNILSFYNYPGHTKGSLVISYRDALFTGDLIFDGGTRGRTDLMGGDEGQLQYSISMLLKQFDESCTIYPGHGNSFSLKLAKQWFK